MYRSSSPAGIGGYRTGWIVVTDDGPTVVRSFADALAALPRDCIIALDMPIGLLEMHVTGGRACDRAARARLGRARASSVFSPPPRPRSAMPRPPRRAHPDPEALEAIEAGDNADATLFTR